ncbi:MAG: YIP1 family protein [Methanomicrobiaceae archaeon]|nr:YIP1 family protein [Methanomicrobiaceae archaeon]
MNTYDYASEKTIVQTGIKLSANTYQLSVTNLRLAFVPRESTGISPFSYYYEHISGIRPVQSGYYEPCIELSITYSNGMTDAMQLVFADAGDRDRTLYAINNAYSERVSRIEAERNPPLGAHDISMQNEYGEYHDDYMSAEKTRTGGYDDYDTGMKSSGYGEMDYGNGRYLSFFDKFTGLIKNPSGTFPSLYSDEFSDGLKFMLVMMAISAVVNTMLTGFLASKILPGLETFSGLGSDPASLVILVLEVFIFLVLTLAIYGLLTFAISRIFGSEMFPDDSMKVTMYSSVPFATVGLIPFFGLYIAPVWTVYLQARGLEECNEIEGRTAIVSSVVAAIILAALFYIIIISGKVGFE